MHNCFLLLEKDIRPVNLELWSAGFSLLNRTVGNTTIGNYFISTVFLGVNHNFSNSGSPVLFETMIFDDDHNSVYMERYTDWEEAEEGHQKTCRLVLAGNYSELDGLLKI